MTIDVPAAIRNLGLAIDSNHAAVVALIQGRYSDAIDSTRAELSGARGEYFAVLHIMARALAKQADPLDAQTRSLFRQWLRRDDVRNSVLRRLLLAPLIRDVSPPTLESLVYDLARDDEDLTSTLLGLAGFLSPPARRRALEQLARHRRDEIREHLFALLGQNHRLCPPGTIDYAKGAEAEYAQLLAIGFRDSNSRVRERAVAAAYGLGLVTHLREHVLALINDPEMAVRQYAIVALGVLDDDTSRNVLSRFLREGSVEECTSAIWAAARRRDLIADVLGMAGDSREWVNNEVLGAFAEVSVPLTDEQIIDLDRRTNSAEFARLRDRHIGRTRRGEPELGPDNRIHVVLKR